MDRLWGNSGAQGDSAPDDLVALPRRSLSVLHLLVRTRQSRAFVSTATKYLVSDSTSPRRIADARPQLTAKPRRARLGNKKGGEGGANGGQINEKGRRREGGRRARRMRGIRRETEDGRHTAGTS